MGKFWNNQKNAQGVQVWLDSQSGNACNVVMECVITLLLILFISPQKYISLCKSLLQHSCRNYTYTSQHLTPHIPLWKQRVCCIFILTPPLLLFYHLSLTIQTLSIYISPSQPPPDVPWCNVDTWGFEIFQWCIFNWIWYSLFPLIPQTPHFPPPT